MPASVAAVLYALSMALPLGPAPRGAAVALLALAAGRSDRPASRLAWLAAIAVAAGVEAWIGSRAGALGLILVAAAVMAPLVLPAGTRPRTDVLDADPSRDVESVLDRLDRAEDEDVAFDVVRELPRLLQRFEPSEVRVWRPAPGDALRPDPTAPDTPGEVVVQARDEAGAAQDPSRTVVAAPLRSGVSRTGVVEVRRAWPFRRSEVEQIARIVRAAGRTEAILRVRRRELGVRAVTVFRYDAGAFRTSAFVSDGWPELERRLGQTWPLGNGVIRTVYEDGEPRFLERYADAPNALAAFVEAGVRAAAVRPMPLRRHAKTHLLIYDDAPRLWTESDRSLVADVSRSLRLSLERDREAHILQRMLAVEHRLLINDTRESTMDLLDELVALVPGAEAGSLLVRRDGEFRYEGVIGFGDDDYGDVTFDEEHLLAWCGGRDAWLDGRARIVSDPDGMEAASLEASAGRTRGHASLRRIVANLSMPVVHRDEVVAVVNLDAFSDRHAFQEEDVAVVKAFAPAVAFVLAEARHRRDLHIASTRDALTELENRRAFDQGLAHEIARADRTGTHTGLLIADLTGFKAVNDRFGHTTGDDVLKRVADGLREVARDSDRLYRWGGDEFAVILPDTDAPGALAAARRFSRAISGVQLEDMRIGASVGLAVRRPGEGMEAEALLAHADQAMYEAKREGVAIAES